MLYALIIWVCAEDACKTRNVIYQGNFIPKMQCEMSAPKIMSAFYAQDRTRFYSGQCLSKDDVEKGKL